MKNVGKVAGFVVLAFCLFAIFTNPTQAGDFVGSIFKVIVDGLDAIATFFNQIMN